MADAAMNHSHRGSGKPLLMIHGLGGSIGSWDPIVAKLAAEREVIAVDLPGFGQTPPLDGQVTIAALADSVTAFLEEHELGKVDVVGSSMGARLALELVRRGGVGATVALDPGGFWGDGERRAFAASSAVSYRLVKALQPIMPRLTGSAAARTALFGQLSARPWALRSDLLLNEMRSYAASPSFEDALHALVHGPNQEGMPAGSAQAPIVIGWGRRDWVTLPRQAPRAIAKFPDARLHWFEKCGHFPHWDAPDETVSLILDATG